MAKGGIFCNSVINQVHKVRETDGSEGGGKKNNTRGREKKKKTLVAGNTE